MGRAPVPGPTKSQIRITRSVVKWYLDTYHGTLDDPGAGAMFCRADRVGHFAVRPAELRSGSPTALFRLLMAVVMFQRLQDQIILGMLRRMTAAQVTELTDPSTLLELARCSSCTYVRTLEGLSGTCDLTKDSRSGLGVCSVAPGLACAPKRHTVWLRRYGHFGKVPTSIALSLERVGVSDLRELYECALGRGGPEDAATFLQETLCVAWRISDKISAMYLSLLSNPDLSPGLAPWAEGVDWNRWVVIDSNVDLFLRMLEYPGPWTYRARHTFLCSLSKKLALDELKPGLRHYNPRIVQQAMYLFMSTANRKANKRDCCHAGVGRCEVCGVWAHCRLASYTVPPITS